MLFRLAKSDDIKAILGLLQQLFEQEQEFDFVPQTAEVGVRSIISDQTIGFILLAEIEGTVVGMINILFTISTAVGGKVAILEDMIIEPDHRSDGLGSNLLQAALLLAEKNGCKRITLLTDIDNYRAHNFYKKNGFEKSNMVPFRIKTRK
jgi:GNAT superfamily N-acetyltransferase